MCQIKRLYKMFIIVLVLSISVQTVSASNEKDYVCVNKVVTEKTPPIPSFIKIDTNIEKKPLCSDGSVPVSTSKDIKSDITGKIEKSAQCYNNKCYSYASGTMTEDIKGVFAYLTQHDPIIDLNYGISSGAAISIGIDNGFVGVGWKKNKGDISRLYTEYKQGTQYCANGCGWVQVSHYYYPGMNVNKNQHGISYFIESTSEGWWIGWNGEWLGYYPGSIFGWEPDMANGAGGYATYQGIVATTIPETTTDMGNGLWGSNTGAAKIFSQKVIYWYSCVKAGDCSWYDVNTIKYSTTPSLYSVFSTSSNSMRYGGPGIIGQTRSITIVSPNGGENWKRGTTKTIKWTNTGSTGTKVKIELLKGGKLNKVISYNAPNTGSYNWKIPVINIGIDYKIRITSTSNPVYKDTSNNNFKIY